MGKFCLSLSLVFCLFIIATSRQSVESSKEQGVKARKILVPTNLADEYSRALDTESQALQAAQQTPQYKDFLTAQQQRLRIEIYIAGELGCKPSQAKIIREPNGRIVVNKDGRIEAIECNDAPVKP